MDKESDRLFLSLLGEETPSLWSLTNFDFSQEYSDAIKLKVAKSLSIFYEIVEKINAPSKKTQNVVDETLIINCFYSYIRNHDNNEFTCTAISVD